MAQKNAKKAKVSKLAKPAKVRKAAPVVSSVLKKAAKVVAKKVGAAIAKKPAAPVKKVAPPAKPAKVAEKKVASTPAPGPASVKGKAAPVPAKKVTAPAPVTAKDKKAAPVPEKGKAATGKTGKRGAEVVLEMPAPKGVALLGREGKKKKGSAENSAASKRRCREPGCEHDFILTGYCRMHYIKNWRKIKRKEAILASGQLNNYVEELVSKYPDKYLDVIRQDLASEKDWSKVVVDLELDSTDDDAAGDEDLDGVAEGVRTGGGGGNRGEFEDDSEGF